VAGILSLFFIFKFILWLKPEIKSEDIPAESDNSGPVRIIVGKSFIEEVERSNKDVLLEFYAPWYNKCF
jgi:hypothetical protein